MYSISGQYPEAAAQLEQVALLSPENAQAIAGDLAAVRAGRNPFPSSRLGTLGIPQGTLPQNPATPAAAR